MSAELQTAVERRHLCKAELASVELVKEKFEGKAVWDGTVYVFDLLNHPQANRAYAWSSPVEGADNPRFYIMLHRGEIRSPSDAVRAAIMAERQPVREITFTGTLTEVEEKHRQWKASNPHVKIIDHGPPIRVGYWDGHHDPTEKTGWSITVRFAD